MKFALCADWSVFRYHTGFGVAWLKMAENG